MKHPRQPVGEDDSGIERFKSNAIVRYLLYDGPFDMNHLAVQDFSDEDRCQFAQLIGYSEDSYGTLSYVQRHEPNTDNWHVDELPEGRYIAYVSGYRDEGLVGFHLQPANEDFNLKNHFPFEDNDTSIYAETEVMPDSVLISELGKVNICGGNVIEIEIVKPIGYKVLKVMR